MRTVLTNAAAMMPLVFGPPRPLEDMPARQLGLLILGMLGDKEVQGFEDRNRATLLLIEGLHRLGRGAPSCIIVFPKPQQPFVVSLRKVGDERKMETLVARLVPLPLADEPTRFGLHRFGFRPSLALVRTGTPDVGDSQLDAGILGRSLRALVLELVGLVEPLDIMALLLLIATGMRLALREECWFKMTAQSVNMGNVALGDLVLEFGFYDRETKSHVDYGSVMSAVAAGAAESSLSAGRVGDGPSQVPSDKE